MASLVFVNCMRAMRISTSLIILQKILCRQERVEGILFLNKLRSAFLTVDDTKRRCDLIPRFLRLFSRLQEGTSGGTDIVHDDDPRPFRAVVTFDKPLSAVAFCLFPYQESVDWPSFDFADHVHGCGYRIRTHGQTSDGVRRDVFVPDSLQNQPCDQ